MMHLWRKLAEPRWLSAHENILQRRARGRLVVISRPERKRLQLEIAFQSRNLSRKLVEEFGGRIEKWPRDWLKRFADFHKSKPLRIGKRLLISTTASSRAKRGTSRRVGRSRQLLCVTRHPARSPSSSARLRMTRSGRLDVRQPLLLVIPASAAFGTGAHATTAMSLRLLECLTREWKKGWSLADLGTGSGILALAARRFGAGYVIGVDIDPKAISIAKANARLNKIGNADFQLADVRSWKPAARWDIIAANLYSELLIEVLPKLKRYNWMILSGVLCKQEDKLVGVLRRNNIEVASVKRRGKWIAVTARKRRTSNAQRSINPNSTLGVERWTLKPI
jgi:ribosomal protein L11 methyltransferase